MITGVHTTFFTPEVKALQAFFRDKLGFPTIDAGEGWLIFSVPEANVDCHPVDSADDPDAGQPLIAFYCDDITQTVAELKAKGVEFTGEIQDAGYALAINFRMPGGFEVQLFQPHYPTRVSGQ